MERSEITALLKSSFLFRQYTEEELELVLDHFRIWDYERGQVIFEQESPAEHLYMVCRGKIFLKQRSQRNTRLMGVYESGEIFGYETLKHDDFYHCTAVAQTSATVLWLDQESIRNLIRNFPPLHDDLQMFFESYLLDLQIPLTWREPTEVVYFFSRRHPLDLFSRLIPLISWTLISMIILALLINFVTGNTLLWILTGINTLVILVWFVLTSIDWSNDYSVITNQRVVFQEKVILLYNSRHESPLHMILSVTTQTDWMSRRFSFGDVLIRTYAGEICLPKVPNVNKVALLIDTLSEKAKSGLLIEEQSHIEEVIRETIGLQEKTEDIPAVEKEVLPKVKSGKLVNGLAGLFKLRKEEDGTVTYWTHWYILFKHIWVPSLVLLVLIVGLIARLVGVLTFFEMQSMLAIAIIIGPASILWWIYQYTDWRNDKYLITDDQVIDIYKKPFGSEEIKAAPLNNILSIEFERLGLPGLLFNFGTVYIKVGETTLTFDNVYDPSEVQRELFSRLAIRDELLRNQEKLAMQKNVANWIEAYHKVSTGKEKNDQDFPENEENLF